MPVFAYRALTGGGRARGGVIGAESARAAWQELRARGVYPTDLREQAAGAGWAGRRLGAEELAAATRQLATLVGAGVPVAEALAAVAEQSEHPALVRGLTVAEARLREGEPLAEALAASPRVFPPLFRDLVRAGEASGALATVLARLADHTEASAALRARLRAALTYPAVMAAATVAVLVFLLAWVVPQLTQLFAETGTRLPLATRLLIGATGCVRRTWWLILAAGAGAAWALARWAATPAGRARSDAALLGAPLAGPIVLKAAVARFARTLGTLLAGGLPLDAALGIAAPPRGTAGSPTRSRARARRCARASRSRWRSARRACSRRSSSASPPSASARARSARCSSGRRRPTSARWRPPSPPRPRWSSRSSCSSWAASSSRWSPRSCCRSST